MFGNTFDELLQIFSWLPPAVGTMRGEEGEDWTPLAWVKCGKMLNTTLVP